MTFAPFGKFVDLDSFQAKLKNDLHTLIERRIQDLIDNNDSAAAPTWLAGGAFQGI